jgi:uncharacterized membrane protein
MRRKPVQYKELVRTLARNFVNGSLVLVPVVATLYVVYFALAKLDGLLGIGIPGLGLVITVGFIIMVGALTSNVVGKQLIEMSDVALSRVPLVKLVYTSLRDFMAALFGGQRRFDRPVLVSVGGLGGPASVKMLGFVTREDLAPWGPSDHVAVYFPQSLNFAGQLLLVPRVHVERLEIEPSQLFPFIVSGGIAGATSTSEAEAVAATQALWALPNKKA